MARGEKFFRQSPDPVVSAFGAELDALYFSHGHEPDMLELASFKLPGLNIKKLITAALDNIFGGFKGLVEPNLFAITYKSLTKAIDSGFGKVEYGKPNYAFVQQLKKSGAWFAARKSYQQRQELAALLADDNGKLRTYRQFKAASQSIVGNYNDTWLKAEYKTAVASARNASRWKEYEQNADLYPNLKYLASRAASPREEHKPLYNVVRPINDDFWVQHYPPSAFNCMCGVQQSDEDVTDVPAKSPKPAPGLDHNPGKTGELFSKSHPYSSDLTDDDLTDIDKAGEDLIDDKDGE